MLHLRHGSAEVIRQGLIVHPDGVERDIGAQRTIGRDDARDDRSGGPRLGQCVVPRQYQHRGDKRGQRYAQDGSGPFAGTQIEQTHCTAGKCDHARSLQPDAVFEQRFEGLARIHKTGRKRRIGDDHNQRDDSHDRDQRQRQACKHGLGHDGQLPAESQRQCGKHRQNVGGQFGARHAEKHEDEG